MPTFRSTRKGKKGFLWWAYVCLTTGCYTTWHLYQDFFDFARIFSLFSLVFRSFSPFFILLSFLFESISSRSYFPFIWYFMLIWDFKVRRHFINAFALINKQEERNGWTRTVLLKGHLFLLSLFVRDKCLFCLFLVLILSNAHLFLPPLTIFSAIINKIKL